MKISLNRDGLLVVDGEGRRIDVSDLPEGYETLEWATDLGDGIIVQYGEEVTDEVNERDLEAEQIENARRLENNLKPLEEPLYKRIRVWRGRKFLSNFDLNKYYMRWIAAAPVPPPPPTAEELAAQAKVDAANTAIQGFTLGTVDVKNRAQLKDMTFAEFSPWYDANYDTAPKVIQLVKRLLFIIIRRVL